MKEFRPILKNSSGWTSAQMQAKTGSLSLADEGIGLPINQFVVFCGSKNNKLGSCPLGSKL